MLKIAYYITELYCYCIDRALKPVVDFRESLFDRCFAIDWFLANKSKRVKSPLSKKRLDKITKCYECHDIKHLEF